MAQSKITLRVVNKRGEPLAFCSGYSKECGHGISMIDPNLPQLPHNKIVACSLLAMATCTNPAYMPDEFKEEAIKKGIISE